MKLSDLREENKIIILDEYIKSIGITHMFIKAHLDNIYSTSNIIKNVYNVVHKYENELGKMKEFVK